MSAEVTIRAEIKGIQREQQRNLKVIAMMKPGGARDRAIQKMTAAGLRAAVIHTHVDTGALRASHRGIPTRRGVAAINLSNTARNPRSGQLTSVYGEYEHARGGRHAFYDLVVIQQGGRIIDLGIRELERGIMSA